MADPVEEGTQKVETPVEEPKVEDGKHPETVSWTQYVGIKEKLGKEKTALETKVSTLEEQAKTTVSAEAHEKVTTELAGTKTLLTEKTTELTAKVEATISEKRAALIKKGVSEETAKGWSEKEIDAALTVEIPKPKPDLGGGGSGGESPVKGLDKIRGGFETLHPSK